MNLTDLTTDPAAGCVYAQAELLRADLTPQQIDTLIVELGGVPARTAIGVVRELRCAADTIETERAEGADVAVEEIAKLPAFYRRLAGTLRPSRAALVLAMGRVADAAPQAQGSRR